MTPKEYLEARLELVRKMDAVEFQEVTNLTNAAARLTESTTVRLTRGVLEATLSAALKLHLAYPDGLPLTFNQVVDLEKPPTSADMGAWWAGEDVPDVVEKVEE